MPIPNGSRTCVDTRLGVLAISSHGANPVTVPPNSTRDLLPGFQGIRSEIIEVWVPEGSASRLLVRPRQALLVVQNPLRLFGKVVQQGRSERRGEAYSVPYVEPLSDARTLLADFINSRLGKAPHIDAGLLLLDTSASSCHVA
jgi:hypothetical protein